MNGPGDIPHPIPYQGSKRRIAPVILAHFPDRCRRIVEPFAGSAALSIAAATKNLAKKYWLNDAHPPLIELWREVLRRPHELADAYERLWHGQQGRERAYFDEVRARFNATHQPVDFLYLLARSVKAVIRYNARGEFNNTPDNRRRGTMPESMRIRLRRTAELLAAKTKLTAWDYKAVLASCSATDLIYMDPPYQGVGGDRDQRYAPRIDHGEFCDELAKLNERGCAYVVSYDGRTGDKSFGDPLPQRLALRHLEIKTGRSSQATLHGRNHTTYESLYLSPALSTVGSIGSVRSVQSV